MIDRVHRAHATGAQTSLHPEAGEDLPLPERPAHDAGL